MPSAAQSDAFGSVYLFSLNCFAFEGWCSEAQVPTTAGMHAVIWPHTVPSLTLPLPSKYLEDGGREGDEECRQPKRQFLVDGT